MRKLFYDFKRADWAIFIVALLLILAGTVMIGSAEGWRYDPNDFKLNEDMQHQLLGLLLGVIAIVVILMVDFNFIRIMSIPVYIISLGFLVLTLKIGGSSETGLEDVRRWIDLGFITFQPSELCKIAMILFMAELFDRFKDQSGKFFFWVLVAGVCLVPIFLVFMEPDLSMTIVMVVMCLSMIFTANLDWKVVVFGILIIIAAVALVVWDAVQESPHLLNAYQADRIRAWLNPKEYELTTAYQSLASQAAIGRGGLRGVGLFNNSGMVPIATTDFIFGVIGEELGFIGSSLFIIALMFISFRTLLLARKCDTVFLKILCVGFGALIGFQTMIHVGVNTAVLPNTGLPLPFVSYGLSSLTMNLVGLGLIMKARAENYYLQNVRNRS